VLECESSLTDASSPQGWQAESGRNHRV
jgi:hypothetical protein